MTAPDAPLPGNLPDGPGAPTELPPPEVPGTDDQPRPPAPAPDPAPDQPGAA